MSPNRVVLSKMSRKTRAPSLTDRSSLLAMVFAMAAKYSTALENGPASLSSAAEEAKRPMTGSPDGETEQMEPI